MAIIDIDRHILSEVIVYQSKVKDMSEKFFTEWHEMIEIRDKTDALLFSHPECKHISRECEFRHKALWKLRERIFKSTTKASRAMAIMASNFSKQEALLTHLVNAIKEVDTGKGIEYKTNGGE